MNIVHSDRHGGHAYTNEMTMGRPVPAFEVPERAESIVRALTAAGHTVRAPDDHGIQPILAVHDAAMVRYLETAWPEWMRRGAHDGPVVPDTLLGARYREGMGEVREPDSPCGRVGYWCFDTATPVVEGTYAAARAAVDVALTAASLVSGRSRAAYGLCRPPGHHAARAMFGGYCYLNNAAIVAQWLAGSGARVGVLDVDVHHGNGTQQLFYRRPDVAFASLHADPARMYPYFSGYADETGAGPGMGATFNQPLPAGTGDEAYLDALGRALDWLLDRSDGPLVVSLGVDTYVDDPIGDMALTTDGYAACGRLVAATGRGSILLQEGGYHTASLGASVLAWLDGLESPS